MLTLKKPEEKKYVLSTYHYFGQAVLLRRLKIEVRKKLRSVSRHFTRALHFHLVGCWSKETGPGSPVQ